VWVFKSQIQTAYSEKGFYWGSTDIDQISADFERGFFKGLHPFTDQKKGGKDVENKSQLF